MPWSRACLPQNRAVCAAADVCVKPGERAVMILAYHEILPEPLSAYHVGTLTFDEHLAAVVACNSRDSSGPIVTFDDGESSQYEHALQLLERHAMKATFFVNVGMIDGTYEIKGTRQEFMTWTQLQSLARLGHRIQSHGWSHQFLTTCSEAVLEVQLVRSRQVLQDKLGTAVDSLSVPGGRWNDRVLRACAQAGYRFVYTSDPWLSAKKRGGVLVQGRFVVRRNTDTATLARYLRARSRDMLWLRIQGALKSTGRLLLGENAYHGVWRRLRVRRS